MIGAYPSWDIEPLAAAFTLHHLMEAADRAAFLREVGPRIRAVVTRGELGADAALIAALPKLEIIACYAVGTDAVALDAARARGIAVTNTPGVLTGDVADLAVGLTLALLRRITTGDAHVRSGAWAGGPMDLTTRMHGKRFGLAGFGRIGQTVGRRLSGFDGEIGYFARTEKPGTPYRFHDSLAALAEWADVLIVTLAGGAATQKLVNAAVLEALGPKGYLVNVARGSVVDEEALIAALSAGRIAGAALDVFLNEPTIDPRLLTLPNLLLQPHAASGTVETRRAMGELMRRNLTAHFAGEPLPTPVA